MCTVHVQLQRTEWNVACSLKYITWANYWNWHISSISSHQNACTVNRAQPHITPDSLISDTISYTKSLNLHWKSLHVSLATVKSVTNTFTSWGEKTKQARIANCHQMTNSMCMIYTPKGCMLIVAWEPHDTPDSFFNTCCPNIFSEIYENVCSKVNWLHLCVANTLLQYLLLQPEIWTHSF